MYCNKCGNPIPDGSAFCPACGAPVAGTGEEQNSEPVSVPAVRVQEPARPVVVNPLYGDCLKWGIMSLAFAASFYLSFLGIFFGYKAKNTCEDALKINNGQPLTGKAKVGSVLGQVGRILGIVMTVLLVIYLIIVVAYAIFAGVWFTKVLDTVLENM